MGATNILLLKIITETNMILKYKIMTMIKIKYFIFIVRNIGRYVLIVK